MTIREPTMPDSPTPSSPAEEPVADGTGAPDEPRSRPRVGAEVDTHPVWLAALRGMARVVDIMVVLVIVGGIARALGATTGRGAIITAVVFNVLLVAYWVAAESYTGTTIGKRLFRLRVTDAAGERPGVSTALRRNLAPALTVVAGVLGLLLAVAIGVSIVTGRGQGLHDRLAGTRVAVARP